MRLLLFVGTGVVLAVLFVVALVVVFRLNRAGRGSAGSVAQQPGYGGLPLEPGGGGRPQQPRPDGEEGGPPAR